MSEQKPPARAESYDKKVALVLQGGGALGSYKLAFTRCFRHPNTCPIGLRASL
jgi:hypothetical protein